LNCSIICGVICGAANALKLTAASIHGAVINFIFGKALKCVYSDC
jgi:hypothetical protein